MRVSAQQRTTHAAACAEAVVSLITAKIRYARYVNEFQYYLSQGPPRYVENPESCLGSGRVEF